MNTLRLTWEDVEKSIQDFAHLIRLPGLRIDPKGVYGEARGGLIPAVMLSHALGLPLFRERPQGICYIWVDDINDRGFTIREAINSEPGIPIRFVICQKKRSPIDVTHSIIVPDDCWVIFPWEDEKKASDDFNQYHKRHD